MSHNRRNFIRKIGMLSAGASLLPVTQLSAAETKQKKQNRESSESDKSIVKVNILQTTDVHCQIHPHDELFWENDK
ncbi:MAG TPA: bifunctional metallophosphatase/5'-nucleotidase, partial [Saprospiraceae bacterium]|nr:bifunctional metallophosphatase/5'-nucleotidase [Saprospiraceae bacterium]